MWIIYIFHFQGWADLINWIVMLLVHKIFTIGTKEILLIHLTLYIIFFQLSTK